MKGSPSRRSNGCQDSENKHGAHRGDPGAVKPEVGKVGIMSCVAGPGRWVDSILSTDKELEVWSNTAARSDLRTCCSGSWAREESDTGDLLNGQRESAGGPEW